MSKESDKSMTQNSKDILASSSSINKFFRLDIHEWKDNMIQKFIKAHLPFLFKIHFGNDRHRKRM